MKKTALSRWLGTLPKRLNGPYDGPITDFSGLMVQTTLVVNKRLGERQLLPEIVNITLAKGPSPITGNLRFWRKEDRVCFLFIGFFDGQRYRHIFTVEDAFPENCLTVKPSPLQEMMMMAFNGYDRYQQATSPAMPETSLVVDEALAKARDNSKKQYGKKTIRL